MIFGLAKRSYFAALGVLLLIPCVVLAGMRVVIFINPEWAWHSPNYPLFWKILNSLKYACMLGTLGAAALLWFAAYALILKSKARSMSWLALAFLGPFGFVGLGMLADQDPDPEDTYQRHLRKLGVFLRLVIEAAFLFAVMSASYALVMAVEQVQLRIQAATQGATMAQVMAWQNASSGMWAFSEMLEEMFLISAIYLIWPIAYNLAAKVARAVTGKTKAPGGIPRPG